MKDFNWKKMITSAVTFVIVWDLVDFAWIKLIDKGEFAFNAVTHIITPIIAAVVYALIEGRIKKKK